MTKKVLVGILLCAVLAFSQATSPMSGTVVDATGGAEMVQTASAAVSSTLGGKQLFELPFATRNAVELLVTQPGVQTPGNPRGSTVNGLPRGALNVTIDGMNAQD